MIWNTLFFKRKNNKIKKMQSIENKKFVKINKRFIHQINKYINYAKNSIRYFHKAIITFA